MIDCLIIGFNDYNFKEYTETVKKMGETQGAYRDLRLAFIEHENYPYRCLDFLNKLLEPSKFKKPLHNADFLWPVILYLGSYLAKRNFTFDYINLFHLEKEELKQKLLKNNILTIAITTTLYTSIYPIIDIIKFIRKHNTTAKIIVGGPFILSLQLSNDQKTIQSIFKFINADFYVINSQGEKALVHILKALKEGGSFSSIDNIAYFENSDYIFTQHITENNSISDEAINYKLFPKNSFNEFVSIRTATSCPFACAYCGFHNRAGKYSYMSVERVEQELNEIKNIGSVTSITFLDDTLNVPKERFKNILRMMIKNKYNFKWNMHYRCDHGDEEMINLMQEAGCEGVFLGVESGNDGMLQVMNKTARRSDYLRAIPLLRSKNIWTHANFIIGFPTETTQTINDTITLIEETEPDTYRLQLWYADPSTPIWQKREHYNITGRGFNWSHETMNAQTACNWIDKIFLSTDKSLWLPQYGFELWSVFYLQRHGLSCPQIKNFIKNFNGLIREEIVSTGNSDKNSCIATTYKQNCKNALSSIF